MTSPRLVLPVYATAEALSFLGNSAIQLVLPWLVLLRTGDPASAGLVLAVAGIAQVAATFVVGQLIDRFGARRMAVLADAGSALSVAALAVVDTTTGLTVPWMIALAVAGAVFDIPGMTARQTLLPQVAAASGRTLEAVATMRQSIFGAAFLAGPALAGALLGVLSPGQTLWIVATCSALAALATSAIRVPPVRPDGAAPGIRGAWGTVRTHPEVLTLLVVASLSSLISAPLVSVLLPLHFAVDDSADLLGLTLSAFATGILAGAAAFAVLSRRSRRTAWTVALVMMTVGLVLMATLHGFWLVAIGAAVVGTGSGIINPLLGVVIAERVPGSQLGRVMGLTNAVALSAAPLGLGLASLVLLTGSPAVLAWGIVGVWAAIAVVGSIGPGPQGLDTPQNGTHRAEEAVDAHH